MATTDLGACEWFVWDLRRSNLIDRGQLDQIIGEFLNHHPSAEPPALAEFLVAQGILTQFQADRLLQGKTQGFVLGPYTLMDALGNGSMGTVYKAVSKNDGNWYAVKVLPRRSMWNVRIARRKVRNFEQLQHPAVVPFVDVGTAGGMHYLAWPMVEGETLDKVIQREGKLKPDVALRHVLQVAEGLDECHAAGLFHGLLKPSNLMLGNDGQLRILDSGIGCLLAETEGESLVDTMSTANSVSSGLDCASPESIMDPTNLTPLGDQYSLGCVLYYLLTGQYPFPDGTAVEKMMAHQHKQPTPIKTLSPDVPDELAAVVERLMQKSPQARYENTKELLEALRQLGPANQGPAVRSLPRPAARPKSGSRPVLPVPPTASRPGYGRPVSETPNPSARQTPPPPTSRTMLPGMGLPGRPTMHQIELPAPPPSRSMPQMPAPLPPPAAYQPQPGGGMDTSPTLEERLGPIGVAVCAILLCVLAWFVTFKLF